MKLFIAVRFSFSLALPPSGKATFFSSEITDVANELLTFMSNWS